MATAKEEKDEQAFFAGKLKEQKQDERKHTMASAHETQAEKEGRAKPEKRMTQQEGIDKLEDLIGTTAPVLEAISLKRQIALIGDPDTELSPEMEAAVEDIEKRTKDAGSKSKTADKK